MRGYSGAEFQLISLRTLQDTRVRQFYISPGIGVSQKNLSIDSSSYEK